jgi:hypothetical protein
MSGLVDVLFSIGVLALFPLTALLLFIALRSKEHFISNDSLVRLKENWPKLKVAVILGSVALFIFLWTELIELLETVFNLNFGFLYPIEETHEIAEVVMIYLLICGVAINLYFVLKIRGGEKWKR